MTKTKRILFNLEFQQCPKPKLANISLLLHFKSLSASTKMADETLVFIRGNLTSSPRVSSWSRASYNGSCCNLTRNDRGGETKLSSSLDCWDALGYLGLYTCIQIAKH
nr:hypothetical protein Iba_scaffold10328CG0020 [Ipomoea batatas]